MDRMKGNFSMDQMGMRDQLNRLELLIKFMRPALHKHFEATDSLHLFFCFRWLLIWFKREFSFEDIMRLWEVLWTDHLNNYLYYFVALSILDQHQHVIMDHLWQFDEILKYINDLNMTIDLDETLRRAEVLYREFQRAMALLDAQATLLVPEEMYKGCKYRRMSRVADDTDGWAPLLLLLK